MRHSRMVISILKWTFLSVAACVIAAAILLYYVMVVRFKDSIRYAVDRETQGRYVFNAGSAELSIWSKTIYLKASTVHCVDTTGAASSYEVRMPEMYFSIATWKDLLLNRKVVIDSMSVMAPSFLVRVHHSKAAGPHKGFQANDILTILNKTLSHFNAHSFTLQDATFIYDKTSRTPLIVRHINLSVLNFTEVNDEDAHLLGSDKVLFSLGRQHWQLAGGKQEISFRGLTFTSEGQQFEVDSFSWRQQAADSSGPVNIYADQVRFNSRHLPAVYQKDELLIDTLTCVNPVLAIPGHRRHHKDSVRIKTGSPLFKKIQIGYINVLNAELQLTGTDPTQQLAATHHTNLRIYNLQIDSARDAPVHTDSIRLGLDKMQFVSRDSMFQISVDEFAMNGDSVLLKKVFYGPTAKNKTGKKMTFTAPVLMLRKVNIAALLRKRLEADQAELVRPEIQLQTSKVGADPAATPQKHPVFYQTLHSISQLIKVRNFHISNGTLNMQQSGTHPLSVHLKKLEADILLHQLFLSDSLVDVKHAIPSLRIGELDLQAGNTKIKVTGHHFDGVKRSNHGDAFLVELGNGSILRGKNIYWEVFDWDVYQQTKDIQVDYLRIGQLVANIKPRQQQPSGTQPRKKLPVVRISRLEVASIAFDQPSPAGGISFDGNNISIHDLRTKEHYFTWGAADAGISKIKWRKNDTQVEAGSLSFSNHRESVLKDISFSSNKGNGYTKFQSPQLRINLPLHSSNTADLVVSSLHMPSAQLDVRKITEKDTLNVSSGLALEAAGIHPAKDGQLNFRSLALAMKDTRLEKGNVHAVIPAVQLQLNEGAVHNAPFSFTGKASATWKNAAFRYHKDSTNLQVDSLSGALQMASLQLHGKKPVSWQEWLHHVTMESGTLQYNTPAMTATVGHSSWDPLAELLQLKNFQITPVTSRDETFKKAKFQNDYLVVSGGLLQLTGITPGKTKQDAFHVRKVSAVDMVLETSRDKQLPFHHGIEKPMPTKLIRAIRFPLAIDTVLISNAAVTYHERSAKTGQWSDIPITAIDARLLHITNQNNPADTLELQASGSFLGSRIHGLHYKESYNDSLSSFTARMNLSPMDLTAFSRIAMPMAGVSVTRGHADTVYSSWQGNKYAAYGHMAFFYEDLHIKVHNKKNAHKWALMPALETWVANLVLPNRKHKPTLIFVERDREKFIFNYWIKAQLRGILSTIGIKKDKRYRKQYQQDHQKYGLPPLEGTGM